jgi:outer membrane lipoprotein carrier protein
MRSVNRRWIVGLAAALGAAGVAHAQGGGTGGAAAPAAADACVERAVERIQRRYESVRDLSADFVQTTRAVALGAAGATTTSRGSVVFAKPGKMRWSYESPEPSLVVSDGKWLWIFDPAHQEAQKLPVGEGFLSGAAIQFLLGEGEIRREFEVTAEACTPQQVELVLVPRTPASYEKLRVKSDPQTGELVETTVVDLLGNVTQVAFSRTRTNQGPADAQFRFEAKAGVRVIELAPPSVPAPAESP